MQSKENLKVKTLFTVGSDQSFGSRLLEQRKRQLSTFGGTSSDIITSATPLLHAFQFFVLLVLVYIIEKRE